MQDLIAPQLESLRGAVSAVDAKVDGVRAEVHSLRNELKPEIDGLRTETRANIARLDDRLTIALDVRERIVALEARLAR